MRHSKTRNMRASVASRFVFVAVLSALLALVSVRADVVASGDLIYGAACDASIMTYGCSGAFDSTAFDSSAFTTNYTTYGYTAANQWLVAKPGPVTADSAKFAFFTYYAPTDFSLQGSNDSGATWVDIVCTGGTSRCGSSFTSDFVPNNSYCTDLGAYQFGGRLQWCDYTFAASTYAWWRFYSRSNATNGNLAIGEWGLYSSAATAHITVSPDTVAKVVNSPWTWNLQAVDASGNDVTSTTTFRIASRLRLTPITGSTAVLTCDGSTTFPHTITGHTTTCVADALSSWLVDFDNGGSLSVSATAKVGDYPSNFRLIASATNITIGERIVIAGRSHDASGNDTSYSDPWVFDNTDTHRHCTQTGYQGTFDQECSWDAAGTYTVVGKESSQGFRDSLTITVTVVSAPPAFSCGATDVACAIGYLAALTYNLIVRLVELPGVFLSQLFTSQNGGPSYIDLSPLGANIWPTLACRSGQTPTAADNVHCYAFPFSVPSDLGTVLAMLNASPSPPTMTINWDFPLWTGTTLHESRAIDPTIVLSNTTMMYVRDVELVMFIIGCALGTWRILQLVGVD